MIRERVYPACAGIDLLQPLEPSPKVRLPRMRGDRPIFLSLWKGKREFTPHARGSTVAIIVTAAFYFVYPACAGIDLTIFP